MPERHYAGHTTPGEGWRPYPGTGPGVYIKVDTSDGQFDSDPVYVISIGGKSEQWNLIGTSTV